MAERLGDISGNRREVLSWAAGIAIRPVFTSPTEKFIPTDQNASLQSAETRTFQPKNEAILYSGNLVDKIYTTLIESDAEFSDIDNVVSATKTYNLSHGPAISLTHAVFDFGEERGEKPHAFIHYSPTADKTGINITLSKDDLPTIDFTGFFGNSDPITWLRYYDAINEEMSNLDFNEIDLKLLNNVLDSLARPGIDTEAISNLERMFKVDDLANIKLTAFPESAKGVDYRYGISLLRHTVNTVKTLSEGFNLLNVLYELSMSSCDKLETLEEDDFFPDDEELLLLIQSAIEQDVIENQIELGAVSEDIFVDSSANLNADFE